MDIFHTCVSITTNTYIGMYIPGACMYIQYIHILYLYTYILSYICVYMYVQCVHASCMYHIHCIALQDKQHLEIQLSELQSTMLDAAEEHKLKKQIKKQRALIKDLQQEVEYTKESGRQSSTMRALRHKLEEKEDIENSLNKTIKKLQIELSETQELGEETERKKAELEGKLSEVNRLKNELELRLEEDQDEIEDLMQKQRHQSNQVREMRRISLQFIVEDLSLATFTGMRVLNHILHSKIVPLISLFTC